MTTRNILMAAGTLLLVAAGEARADSWVPIYNAGGVQVFTASTRAPAKLANGWCSIWIMSTHDYQTGLYATDCRGMYSLRFGYTWTPADLIPPDSIASRLADIACR